MLLILLVLYISVDSLCVRLMVLAVMTQVPRSSLSYMGAACVGRLWIGPRGGGLFVLVFLVVAMLRMWEQTLGKILRNRVGKAASKLSGIFGSLGAADEVPDVVERLLHQPRVAARGAQLAVSMCTA